jgi:outer membrane receptor protein involved in Fe transport
VKATPAPQVKAARPAPVSKSTPAASPQASQPAGAAQPVESAEPSAGVRMSPVAGSELPIEKIPGAVGTVSANELQRYGSQTPVEALQQRVPGIIVNDTLGSPLANDLQYRGFSASPLNGTPQGLAVYQNGVRINEVFGDSLNWDVVPAFAIRDISVMGSNPVFGLNALGGSVNLVMKDGFNFQGLESDARFGSFGRRHGTLQGGAQWGNVAAYVGGDTMRDTGYRDLSPSRAKRMYADLGAKNDVAEFHLNYTGARNLFGVVGPTPVELVNQRRANVFTTPQMFDNRMSMVNLNGTVSVSDTLKLSGVMYWRGFRQRRPDGNISDVETCKAPEDPAFLCVEDGGQPERVHDRFGNEIPSRVLDGGIAGSNDRTSVDATSIGGSLQATSKAKLAGFGNQFTLGGSIDQGRASVASASELGLLDPRTLVVQGLGIILGGDEFAPRSLAVRTNYYGIYATDTLDLTDRLSLTMGGRFNIAHVELKDRLGDDLNGSHQFSRFNPMAGVTFKVLPGLSVYGGYAEANRAPTPAELACADPNRPCLLENFLVSDPPLKQVVSRTVEAGFRGQIEAGPAPANDKVGPRIEWSLGVFRALNTDDIINVASETQGRGYFLNAGRTLRQGIEASLAYKSKPFSAYASYAMVDATFRDALELSAPDNPTASDEGSIHVQKGDHIPSIPRHRFKVGADYGLTQHWRVGADLVAASSQFFRGDEGNDVKPLPGYWIVNLKTSYDLSKSFQIYGIVENVFDRKYASFGTFYDTGPLADARGLSDPRTITPAPPLSAYGGVKVKF